MRYEESRSLDVGTESEEKVELPIDFSDCVLEKMD
jgi:hypothetical protein